MTEVCCDDWPVLGHRDHPPTSNWSHSTVYYFKISSSILTESRKNLVEPKGILCAEL